MPKRFCECRGYDFINRLKDLDRGTLSGGKDGVTDLSFAECWALDQTGNWKNYRQDDDGSGTWDLNQNRAANTVNEITDISESTGPSWVTPVYNRAGNMTTMPQPNDPTASYGATYDAWNRLVKLVDGSDTVSEYAYDGARRRVIQKSYAGGVLDETRHLYYTAGWRNIEERVGTETTADKQFVWGRRYIDDIILRDDTTQRLYGLQDANWNGTSITDDAGGVQERFAYAAYGVPVFMNTLFIVQPSSASGWETLYCGYRFESATALMHVRNRVYQTPLGVWLQRDPTGLAAGVNLYAYADSDPENQSDPSGLFITILIVVIVAGGILLSPATVGAPGPGESTPPSSPHETYGAMCCVIGGMLFGGQLLGPVTGTAGGTTISGVTLPAGTRVAVTTGGIAYVCTNIRGHDEELCDCYCGPFPPDPFTPPNFVGRMSPAACAASGTLPHEEEQEVCSCGPPGGLN